MNQQLFPHFFTFSVQNRNMTTFIFSYICGLGYFHHTLSYLTNFCPRSSTDSNIQILKGSEEDISFALLLSMFLVF